MRATFGFDKATSPVNRAASMGVKTHPQAQYMALCQFTNVFWEFDTAHNHAPTLVFEGEIERLDAIETKFPHNIDTVFFTDHKPRIRYDYQFDRRQHEILASKGFWDENGVRIPELFTTSKFQLECDVVVDEVTKAYETQKVPIMNISIQHPYENTFCTDQYDIAEFITAAEPEESANIQHVVLENTEEVSIAAEVEAAKQAAAALAEAEKQAAYVPLTPEEMEIRRQSSNVDKFVNDIRERHRVERDEHNAVAEAEKARIKAEQEALANKDKPAEKDKNLVEFDDTAISKASSNDKLVETDDTNKFENNEAIFNDVEPAEEEALPDNVAAFMSKLGWSEEKPDEKSDDDAKKDDKKDDNGSGAASGAQGLGVYTFEDRSTAQFEMRQDEGKGNENEKDDNEEDGEEEKSENDSNDKSDNKPEQSTAQSESETDKHRREAQLASAINDTTVTVTNNRDRNDRSK